MQALTLVLGWPDQKNRCGIGKMTVVAGPDIPKNEQVAIVQAAKATGAYPKGIGFLELVHVLPGGLVAIATPATKK